MEFRNRAPRIRYQDLKSKLPGGPFNLVSIPTRGWQLTGEDGEALTEPLPAREMLRFLEGLGAGRRIWADVPF